MKDANKKFSKTVLSCEGQSSNRCNLVKGKVPEGHSSEGQSSWRAKFRTPQSTDVMKLGSALNQCCRTQLKPFPSNIWWEWLNDTNNCSLINSLQIVLDIVSLRVDLCLHSIDMIHSTATMRSYTVVYTCDGYPDFYLYSRQRKRSHGVS